MPDCPQCGERMTYNDETTKLLEFVCSRCHKTRILHKDTYRVTA